VPNGSDFKAMARSQRLMIMAAAVISEGQSLVKPSEYFIETAHTVSNKPAMIKISQGIRS